MMKPTLNIITANNPTVIHNVDTPANDNTVSTTTADNAEDNPEPNRRKVSTRPTKNPLSCVPAIIANEFTANSHAYVCGEAPNSCWETNENTDTYVNSIPKLNPNVSTGLRNRG